MYAISLFGFKKNKMLLILCLFSLLTKSYGLSRALRPILNRCQEFALPNPL